MKNWWEKIKEHPIYSKVVAQIIVYAIIGIIGLIYFQSILNFFRQEWIVPMWGLVLIGIIPAIVILIVYIFLNRQNLIFVEEEGTYKDKNSESRFCSICKSQLQKIDNHWFCNKCKQPFGKPLVAASCSSDTSPRVAKSKFMSELHRRW